MMLFKMRTGPHLDQLYKGQFSCTTGVGKRISHSIYALLLLLNIFGEFISGQLFSAQSGNDANVGWVVLRLPYGRGRRLAPKFSPPRIKVSQIRLWGHVPPGDAREGGSAVHALTAEPAPKRRGVM